MHDMVHDVACDLMGNECLMVTGTHNKVDQNHDLKAGRHYCHLTIIHEDNATFPVPPCSSERLYTFSVQSFQDCPQVLKNVYRSYKTILTPSSI